MLHAVCVSGLAHGENVGILLGENVPIHFLPSPV